MDVDSDPTVHEGIARIVRDNGPIEVVVNNAGIEADRVRRRAAADRVLGRRRSLAAGLFPGGVHPGRRLSDPIK